MIWIDYTIIILIILFSVTSFIRGFIREALSLINWICAFFISTYYYRYITIYFTYIKEQIIKNSIAIIFLFMLTLLIGAIINYIIRSSLEEYHLSSINKILGGLLGIIQGLLIVSLIIFFLDFSGVIFYKELHQSQLVPKFRVIIKLILNIYNNNTMLLY